MTHSKHEEGRLRVLPVRLQGVDGVRLRLQGGGSGMTAWQSHSQTGMTGNDMYLALNFRGWACVIPELHVFSSAHFSMNQSQVPSACCRACLGSGNETVGSTLGPGNEAKALNPGNEI